MSAASPASGTPLVMLQPRLRCLLGCVWFGAYLLPNVSGGQNGHIQTHRGVGRNCVYAPNCLHRQNRPQVGPAVQGLEILDRRGHKDAPADQATVTLVKGVEHWSPLHPRPKQVCSKCSRITTKARP